MSPSSKVRMRLHAGKLLVFALVCAFYPQRAAAQTGSSGAPSATSAQLPVGSKLLIFDGGLKNNWQDWGWAKRQLSPNQPAQLNMTKYAGWILASRNLSGSYSALSFKLKNPAGLNDYLEVRLGNDGAPDDTFVRVPITAEMGTPDAEGFIALSIPIATLNPQNVPFDRVVFRARKSIGPEPVLIDTVALTAGAPSAAGPTTHAAHAKRSAKLRIDCKAASHPISELIYGIAFSPRHVDKDPHLFKLGASIRRWGGNPASRYNWKLGNAWNTASDWFFQNVNYTSHEDYSWKDFLSENKAHKLKASITLPMLGWVAKDTSSYSFSVASMGSQKYTHEDAGNGISKDGTKLTSPPPSTTCTPAPPSFVAEWVQAIEKWQSTEQPGQVAQYILDNEPMLWNSTHRDIHPEAATYDELLSKSIAYGEAVRRVAPKAEIASPALWGWPAYFFSAKDAEAGFRNKPDRLAHGDTPFLAWFLRRMHERAQTHGLNVVDTVDVHFYPQGQGTYGNGEQTSAAGAARRIRAVRSLWDPSYKDESWIADNIELIPRLRRIIAENYPGRRISIGEYNFGGERHISGALALAEALGRFGEEGVHSAYNWTYPPAGSPAEQAFLAFRNYDGQGAKFETTSLQAQGAQDVSLFASRSAEGKKVVAMALNLDADTDIDADIELRGCGALEVKRVFSMSQETPKLSEQKLKGAEASKKKANLTLPAYSINVVELSL